MVRTAGALAGAALVFAAVAALTTGALDADRVTVQLAAAGGDGLARVADQCRNSVGPDGFGRALVNDRLVVSNASVDLAVPCRVVLASHGHIILNNVRLSSRHLILEDGDEHGSNLVRINNSVLTGDPDSGLLLELRDEDDRVEVHNSTVDYDRSVWIRVFGSRDSQLGGGRLVVTNSSVRSEGPATQGIELIAGDVNGGRAIFTSVELGSPQEILLLAETCTANELRGAPTDCGPLDDSDFDSEP